MKKLEYIKAVKKFVKEHRQKSFELDQEKMIRSFARDELKRVRDCFNDHEEVGYVEELQELARRFQGNWRYENQSAMTCIF